MDDAKLEQVTEKVHTAEANSNGLRNELKKLTPVEKMRNATDFKTF